MCLNSSISRFLRGVKLPLSRSGVREKVVCISPDSARKPIPIVRKQRLRRHICRFIDKGNYSGCSGRVRKPGIQAWDPLFSPGVPPTPRTRVVHPLPGVRRPGWPCVAACLRAHGWPLRVRRVTGPVHTYRGDQHGDGERRTRFLRRAHVRVARAVPTSLPKPGSVFEVCALSQLFQGTARDA